MSGLMSSNPVLNERAFEPSQVWRGLDKADRSTVMTVQGTAMATAILLAIVAATAIAVWTFASTPGVLIGACIGGLVAFGLTVAVCFRPQWSPVVAWPIAVFEGGAVGAMSVFWSSYAQGRIAAGGTGFLATLGAGLVIQAVLMTIGVASGVLLLNMFGVLRATPKFVMIVGAATMGIFLVSMASMLLGMFGVQIPYLWQNGLIGIGFAIFVVVIAALNLVMNFDFIRSGADNGLPKHMEWYGAIGLLVTLVWLYLSVLRLLAMLSRRD